MCCFLGKLQCSALEAPKSKISLLAFKPGLWKPSGSTQVRSSLKSDTLLAPGLQEVLLPATVPVLLLEKNTLHILRWARVHFRNSRTKLHTQAWCIHPKSWQYLRYWKMSWLLAQTCLLLVGSLRIGLHHYSKALRFKDILEPLPK